MTPDRLAELLALVEAATLGPWERDGCFIFAPPEYGDTPHIIPHSVADQNFIAAARTALPELIADYKAMLSLHNAVVDRALKDVTRAEAALQSARAEMRERCAKEAEQLTESRHSRLVDGPHGTQHGFVHVPLFKDGKTIATLLWSTRHKWHKRCPIVFFVAGVYEVSEEHSWTSPLLLSVSLRWELA